MEGCHGREGCFSLTFAVNQFIGITVAAQCRRNLPVETTGLPFSWPRFWRGLIDTCKFQMTGSNKTLELMGRGHGGLARWINYDHGSLQDVRWGGRCSFHQLRIPSLGMGHKGTFGAGVEVYGNAIKNSWLGYDLSGRLSTEIDNR